MRVGRGLLAVAFRAPFMLCNRLPSPLKFALGTITHRLSETPKRGEGVVQVTLALT